MNLTLIIRLFTVLGLQCLGLSVLNGQNSGASDPLSINALESRFAASPNAETAKNLSQAYLDAAKTAYKRKHNDSIPFFLNKSQALWEKDMPQTARNKAESFFAIGGFYLEIKNYVLADNFFTKANEWALQTDDDAFKCSVQLEWAYVKVLRGLMEEAADLVSRWQDKIESFGDPMLKKQAFQRVGAFYNAYGTPEKARLALPYLKRGLAIAEETLGPNHPRIVFNLGVLRNTYKTIGQIDSVIAIGKHLETLLPQLDVFAKVWVLMTNGSDYLMVNDLPKARAYLTRTWSLIEANNMQESDDGQYTLFLFGKLAIAEGRYAEAESYLNRALTICKTIDYKLGIQDVLTQLVVVAEKQGRYQEQARLQKELSELTVAITKENYAKNIAAMEVELNIVQKDRKISEQKAAQQLLWIGLLLMVFIAVLSSWFYWRLRKQQKQLSEKNNLLALKNDLIDQQNKELTHLDEAKTRFFANVSHELRTPLTLMLGPLAAILKRNQLDNHDFTYARLAQTHGKALLKLVNEILDLSKLESGKMQIHDETVDFQSFMRRLVSAFESHADRLGITFQFVYKADKHLRLSLDADKWAKIVNNLLSNALKFTPKGGTITVTIEDLANVMRLTVSDTGRGIHPDDLPSVFDRFYQSEQKDAPIEGGTGIGLALCREFVDIMQGRIWVESALDKGSQFYVELPKKEVLGIGNQGFGTKNAENTEGAFTTTDSENGDDSTSFNAPLFVIQQEQNPLSFSRNKTVLVVEDNVDLRTYLSLILRGANFKVVEAENGLAALDVLQELYAKGQLPQLIVSDIMMPVMDGFQLLKVLKDRDYFRSIPVVMLTARADIQDKINALRIGVDDYLLKPFEEEELLARVENLLRNYDARGQILAEIEAVKAVEPSRNIESATTNNQSIITNNQSEWLAELEQVVAKSMSKTDFHTEGVAEQLFMGRSQFFVKVKQLTGMTPNEYIQEMRLTQARTLLENRRVATVKEAAFSVGFKDVRYFSELFKKRFGKLPSEYLS